MRSTRSIIIENVAIKRIMVHIDGENTNPHLTVKALVLRDYITNTILKPTTIT